MGSSNNPFAEEKNIQQMVKEAQSILDESHLVKKVNGELYGEIGQLAKYLSGILTMVEATGEPMGSTGNELPQATGVLDDVNRITEEGTHRVFGHSEKVLSNHEVILNEVKGIKKSIRRVSPSKTQIQRRVSNISSLLEENKTALMDIATALEFQDLAGQRIKKTVGLLQEVQSRLLKLVVLFGIQAGEIPINGKKQEEILNELETSSKNESLYQELVDEILKEFGF